MRPIKNILCPTDYSNPSREAVELGCEFAARFGATVHLVHSVEIPPPPGVPHIGATVAPYDTSEYESALRQSAEENMSTLAEAFAGKAEIVRHLLEGKPADMIIETANNVDADLIVIATHGLSGWRKLLFGSVTEKVVRRSPCPVLTVNERRAKA